VNQRSKNWVFLFVSGLLLVGCQANRGITDMFSGKPSLSKGEFEGHSEVAFLLGYFRFLDSLSPEALSLEVTRSKKTLSKFHDPSRRLRLAMLLSLPPSDSQDYDRALELLNKNLEASTPNYPILRDFSLFLSAAIHRFKKQDEHAQDLDKKLGLKKTQDEKLTQNLKKLEDQVTFLSRQLEDESARSKKLQEMIDGLKVIEKNIIIGE